MSQTSIARVVATFFGQTDFIYNQISLDGKDGLRLLSSKLGEVNFAPISIKVAIEGMLICTERFVNELSDPNETCKKMINQITLLNEEIHKVPNIECLNISSLTKTESKFRKWHVFQIIAYSSTTISPLTLEITGAYLLMLLGDFKVSQSVPKIIHKLINSGPEILTEKETKAIARLHLIAKLNLSTYKTAESYEGSLDFSKLLPFIYKQKVYFADAKSRQGALDFKTLAINDFLEIASQLRTSSESGNVYALKVVIASFIGIPFKYINQVPLQFANDADWDLVVDIENGVIKFDLELVAPHGVATYGDEYVQANKILVKPLPSFVHRCLQAHISKKTNTANSIGELLNDENNHDKGSLEYDISAKFINSLSRIAVQQSQVDPFHACLIACDFRIIPNSKTYYRQTSRQEIWESSAQFFQSIGWGDPVVLIDGLNFGSQAVLTDDCISRLFENLAFRVNELRPSNNCQNIERLIEFHNTYTELSATMAIFCLALRETILIPIYANEVLADQTYLLINDKNVHGSASLQPVTINPILSEQFKLYRIHCKSLLKRLSSIDKCVNSNLTPALTAISDQANTPLFISSTHPNGISTSFLSKGWPEKLVPNFGRHYWETCFPKLGITGRESSAHLRHQTSANLNWSATSDLLLDVLIDRVGSAQAKQMQTLKISAVHGLSKRDS